MDSLNAPLRTLLIGGGVIGSIYGGQIVLAGHRLWILTHGQREQEVARNGIQLYDIDKGVHQTAKAELVQSANEREYDLVLVAVQAGQLASTFPTLRLLKGSPHIIFFGNNPAGHSAIPNDLPGSYELAFPGVGGSLRDGVVEYAHIAQQPTTFETELQPVSKKVQAVFESQGFRVQRTSNMDGWLQYHAVLISCISAALLAVGVNPVKLGNDRKLLNLLCRAIEEGFKALDAQHIQGLPRNLRVLHSMFLRPIARHYWGKLMRSPKGEMFFAGHVRHSADEVHELVQWTLKHTAQDQAGTSHLRSLLQAV